MLYSPPVELACVMLSGKMHRGPSWEQVHRCIPPVSARRRHMSRSAFLAGDSHTAWSGLIHLLFPHKWEAWSVGSEGSMPWLRRRIMTEYTVRGIPKEAPRDGVLLIASLTVSWIFRGIFLSGLPCVLDDFAVERRQPDADVLLVFWISSARSFTAAGNVSAKRRYLSLSAQDAFATAALIVLSFGKCLL